MSCVDNGRAGHVSGKGITDLQPTPRLNVQEGAALAVNADEPNRF